MSQDTPPPPTWASDPRPEPQQPSAGTGPSAPTPSAYAPPAGYPPQGGYPPPSGWAPAGYAPPNRTNPLAVASLVCSLAGLVTGITVIAGIVLGHIALAQIRQTGEDGRTMALAGVIIGYVLVAIGILAIVAFILFFSAIATIPMVSSTFDPTF